MKNIVTRNNLRVNEPGDIERKKNILFLSALGLIDFSIISLYQTGVIKKLPDLPFAIFDSNKVNASKEAYRLGLPDGPVSAAVYAVTILLASAGTRKDRHNNAIYDVLLGGTIAANTAGALFYLYDMIFKQKRICIYCVSGAAINIASAVILGPLFLKRLRRIINFRDINIGSIL